MSALQLPVSGATVSSGYGPRSGGFHHGIDYAAALGTPIVAAANGTVAAAGPASGFGEWIILDHVIDGKKVSTVYGHMYAKDLLVVPGQIVKQGEHIANVGANGEATGPHCHFEVWVGGRLTGGKDVDPSTYLGASTSASASGSSSSGPLGTIDTLYSLYDFLTTASNWWRMFLFVMGIGLIAFFVWSIMKSGVAT